MITFQPQESMVNFWEFGGKRFGATMVMVLVSLLLAVTCLSGFEAAEVASSKGQQQAAGNTKESWRPKLRARPGLNETNGYGYGGGYTRLRKNSCTIQPSACLNPSVPRNTCCGAACFDLDSDPWNCGKCNRMCRLGRVCCSGKCKNVNRDKHNCGSCKTKCAVGASCSFGLCGY